MSGNVRRQLGPVRKRLTDRIVAATELLTGDECTYEEINTVRSKLASNIIYHKELTDKLGDIEAKI